MLTRARFLVIAGMLAIGAALAAPPAQGDDAPIKAGDRVVTTERAPVKAAEDILTSVDVGTELVVTDVKQDWAGVTVEQQGRKIAGWVMLKHLRRAEANPASERFKRGYASYQKGEFDKALDDYSEAIRLDPKQARAYNNRGLAYQAKGDLDQAIADFNQALRLEPALGVSYLNRGRVYAAKNERERAIADYSEAIRLDPRSGAAYRQRGEAYQAVGEPAKARADFAKAEELGDLPKRYLPKYHTIAHLAIDLELDVKNKNFVPNYELLDSIIDEAKAKIQTKPSYSAPEAVNILRTIDGILQQRRFLYWEEVLFCEALVPRTITPAMLNHLDPRKCRFHPHVGESVYFSNCLTTCLFYAAIGEALGLPLGEAEAPAHIFVRWYLADGSHVNWESTSGRAETDASYAVNRKISQTALQNGVYLADLAQDQVLAGVLSNLSAVWQGKWAGLQNEYRQRSLAARNAQSIACLTRAIELYPKFCGAYNNRALCWTAAGQFEKAIADFTMAIQLDPHTGRSYNGRGSLWLQSGNLPKAIDDFNRAIALSPADADGYRNRAVAWAESGELGKAQGDIATAIELNPQDAVAYRVRARLWQAMGKGDKAAVDLNKAAAVEQGR